MRWLGRRLRGSFGIGSSRMAIRSQLAWHWRWTLNVLMMAAVGGIVWWFVQDSHRITGLDAGEVKQRMAVLGAENDALKRDLDSARSTLVEREQQLRIEKAAQAELARTVAQLQEQNAALKDDLGFLRKMMSSGAMPEGIAVSDLRVEPDGTPNTFRYHMLLTQGGQRKQDFKGRLQLVAHVLEGTEHATLVFPNPAPAAAKGDPARGSAAKGAPAAPATGALDFRFYQKVEGRFAVPDGAVLRSVDVRVLALPGGQVKLSRTVNFP